MDVAYKSANIDPITEELVGKSAESMILGYNAQLTTALSYADGVAQWGITKASGEGDIIRVIIVADGQTFTFE